MERRIVNTDRAPAAVGPYSQAVVAGGLVFTAGQIPVDPATGELIDEIRAATRRVLENLDAVLRAAGSSLEQAVKLTVFMTDLGQFAAMNEVYAEFFPETHPARSAVEVARLPKNAVIEAEAVAVRPADA
ncbi:MAG: reactive intermediate/imine deaminase [Candidatus Coatesbacteria bacterium]|nr:reactive intermediate/imine deaminase [Candidatus Coatesbacteria bacterium]